MEIGSFIELQFPSGREFFSGDKDIARLNSGRTAIFHAVKVLGCDTVWLPYYQCDTVRDFLLKKGIHILYYHIDSSFTPIDIQQKADEAVLLVNYYGIMSQDRMIFLSKKYHHCIIDNSQAFFCRAIPSCMNVYSCRKFVGVPDGAYLIGPRAESFLKEYPHGFSSDTSLFLLQRIEYGCEGKAYLTRSENEHRIDHEDVRIMSKLTRTILDGTDYGLIRKRRHDNFLYASELFGVVNRINPLQYYADDCVPMVYPLVIEKEELLNRLLEAKHFQGHWWSYLCAEMPETTFEYWLSRFVIPITIDQRYSHDDLDAVFDIVANE